MNPETTSEIAEQAEVNEVKLVCFCCGNDTFWVFQDESTAASKICCAECGEICS